MRILIFVTAINILFSAPTFACKCGQYSSADEQFDKADLVFVGSKVLGQKTSAQSPFLFFTSQRFAKGDEASFGSNRIKISFRGDVNILCRGYQDKMSYLVFAIKNEKGSYSFLTDCYHDSISADGPSYEYRGKKYTEFNFFKVNPTSAFNGMRPRFASDLTEKEAKELGTAHLFKTVEFRTRHLNELSKWAAISALRKQDNRYQSFWRVKIGQVPGKVKGEFYFVDFYNSLEASFRVSQIK